MEEDDDEEGETAAAGAEKGGGSGGGGGGGGKESYMRKFVVSLKASCNALSSSPNCYGTLRVRLCANKKEERRGR